MVILGYYKDFLNSFLDQLATLEITDSDVNDKRLGDTLRFLLIAVEQLAAENQQLKADNQKLKDEINQLKGEQGQPTIRPQKKDGDISSESERKVKKPKGRRPKRKPPKIDRSQRCIVDLSSLPEDAVYKGIETVVIQDIVLKTDNVGFHREVYYSALKGKRYLGGLPAGYEGEFGPGVKALVVVLYHDAHMSQPAIVRLLTSCGLDISAATVSRMLLDNKSGLHEEKTDIVEAGLQSTYYQHIDDTSARVNGKNHYVHVVCNPFYTAYFTRAHKDRLTIVELLSPGGMVFRCNLQALEQMKMLGLSAKQLARVEPYVTDQVLLREDMDCITERLFPEPRKQTTNRKIFLEACAITGYRSRPDAIDLLICDDAPQFKSITELLELCWVHEGRHYKKLHPVLSVHQQQVEEFLTAFWVYYRKLLAYKDAPTVHGATTLSQEFDQLVSYETSYNLLGDQIEKTQKKKANLLLVLDYPEIELHNNSAELGARAQARKRDVSLQTKNETGTAAKDALMTVVQTAKKLGVNIMDYAKDRITRAYQMPSLADLIRQRSRSPTPNTS